MATNRVALVLLPLLEGVSLAAIPPPHRADLGREALDPRVPVPLVLSAATPPQTPILLAQNQLLVSALLPLLAQALAALEAALVRQQPLLLEVELALAPPLPAKCQPRMEQLALPSIQ